MKFPSALIALFFASDRLQEARAHGTQTRHCVTSTGNLRIFVEHWHGFLSSPGVAGTMTIQDLTANTQQALIPHGVINDVTAANLHTAGGCQSPVTTLATICPNESGYNDWVYYDFEVSCAVHANYRFISGNTYYLQEACSNLYPVDFTESIACATDEPTPAPIPM